MDSADRSLQNAPHVFLSYSSQDMVAVGHIRQALERAGHAVFQDRTSIKGGDDWVATIEAGLRQAYAVVLVVSEHTARNRWVRIETLSALSLGKPIVPISLTVGFIPFEILHINVIDGTADLPAAIERLLESLPLPPLLTAGARDSAAAVWPANAGHIAPGDDPVDERYPLLRHVVRLASDLLERREIGIPFVAFLGSGCVLGSDEGWAARLRSSITGSPSYDALLAFSRATNPQELTAILRRHLRDLEPPPAYLALASLAAAGWLGLIVTMNVDTCLEQALADAGLAPLGIEKLIAGQRPIPELLAALERPSPGLRLLKVSGDIDTGISAAFGPGRADAAEWERVLANILRHDALVIAPRHGDPDLASCLRPKGDLVWLLDPRPRPDPRLTAILEARGSMGRYVETGGPGLPEFLGELARVLAALAPDTQASGRPTGNASAISSSASRGTDADRMGRLAKLQDDLAHLQRRLHAQETDREQPSASESEIIEQIELEIDALSQAGEGTILGGFRIQSKLGQGGIGHVYRAVHLFTGVQAVVKIMSRDHATDPVMRSRFFRGARIMATLSHPNIVRIVDLGGRVGPWNYYVMEYIEGSNLEIVLAADMLDGSARWQMAQAVVEAIAAAHGQPEGPIVHRDIKPSNILIDARGIIKVTDFDTAFLEDSGPLTHLVTAPFGTSFYAPPELDMAPTLSELRDPRVDVFALGRVLFRIFTGMPTVERFAVRFSSNPDMLRLALSGRVPGPAASPLSLLLCRAMDYDPASRFASASDMLSALIRVREIAARAECGADPAIGLSFVRTEAGSFMMGSPAEEPSRDHSEVLHHIVIGHQLLASQTPVTRAAWATVWGEEPPDAATATLPMENVSWYEALSFCNALSMYLGLTPCYVIEDAGIGWDRAADGFRLPTEAEWEYLCRAGTSTTYNLGDAEQDLAAASWYERNCDSGPVPVAQKEPNAWGLCDMHGNVWEWCWDWSGPYPETGQVDPEGPATGRSRVLRGGSWRRSMHHCRSATRYESTPENHGKSLGFRVVRTLAQDPPDE